MMLGIDVSKYTIHVTPEVMQTWRDAGVGLLIIQAHPAFYGQERSLEIMRAAQAAGMPWDAYVYGYLAYPDWMVEALSTLDLAAAEGLVPRKLWLDVEDVDSGKSWTPAQREAAVRRDLTLCDQWTEAHPPLPGVGMPYAAIYSAKWYWDAYMGDADFSESHRLWAAQYDNVADASVFTPFGGWQSCRIKQYAGSQPDGSDLDVLSALEEAELTQPTSDCSEVTAQRDGLINSLGYIAGDLLAPVAKQKTSTVALRRLVAGIRAQAEQQGIAHA